MHLASTFVEQIVDASDPEGFATVERSLELLGLFVFAISGGMLAVRKGGSRSSGSRHWRS